MKLSGNVPYVPYHKTNPWGKFEVDDVIMQVITSSQSFHLLLASQKIHFAKIAIKTEQKMFFNSVLIF